MNLNYGCGIQYAPDWYNCDGSPTVRLRLRLLGSPFLRFVPPAFPRGIHYGEIANGLPLPADSCDAIYCSHVLEHLSLEDCRSALRNTKRYLKPRGLLRCVVPAFEQQIATYLTDPKPAAAVEFLSYPFFGRKTRPRKISEILRDQLGNSHHLWMWDFKALAAELATARFKNIRRCEFGDSRNPVFGSVETRGRFEWALAIECTK